MGGWPWRIRRQTAACCLPLALMALTSPGPAGLAVRPAGSLVAARRAALARARARVSAADRVLTGLETRAEVLTERYDQAEWAQQQSSAAYDVAAARLAAATRAQAVNHRRLAALAVDDVEAGGDASTGVLMLGGADGPTAYFNAVGLSEVLAERRVDLVEASEADGTVTALFRQQAAELLAQRRKDLATARYLRNAVEAAVNVQLATVAADKTRRGDASAALARAEKAESALAGRHHPASASVAGGGLATGIASPGPSPAWGAGAGASASQGVTAADWALTQLGKPYRWGGAGPAVYDCSGLVMDAWARAGIKLAHWTGYQWASGPHVPLGQLRPGDLLFYATNVTNAATIHHVGIYIGNGLMVDAPYTGADVRIDSIRQYAGLIGATRPAPQ